jgi:hypothetical protein
MWSIQFVFSGYFDVLSSLFQRKVDRQWRKMVVLCVVRHLLSVSFKHISINLNIFTGILKSMSVLYTPLHGNVFLFISSCLMKAEYLISNYSSGRSKWPRGLWRRSAAARLLRLWVRIPPGAWRLVSCECCVLSGRGL